MTDANQTTDAPLPPLIFVPLLAALLRLTESATRRAIHRGDLGPFTHIGRRLVVRRESLLKTLEARETRPQRLPRGDPMPTPPRWTEAITGHTGRQGAG